MAYIAPNSTIEFFADMGMDSGYDNTMYFASTQAKDNYFNGLLKEATVTAQSYTRTNRGVIKVQLPMSTMYKCGYMRYKNTSFENKWFYAFINSVEYINNITTEVQFTIDIITTWMGAFTLGACFVERQHTLTDNIGDNIVDEGIPCGDLKDEFVYPSGFLGSITANWSICLVSTADPTDGTDQHGDIFGGIYSGAGQYYYDATDVSTLNARLAYLASTKPSAIIGLAIVPGLFKSLAGSYAEEKLYFDEKPYTDVDGYTPKNNKLFIYPYKSLQVTNMEGNYAEYRYEFFNHVGTNPNLYEFELYGVTGLQSEVCCSPLDYKNQAHNITEKISMSDFPMCSYNVDAFNAYIAQNKSSIAANVMSAVASNVTSLALTGSVSHAPSSGLPVPINPNVPSIDSGMSSPLGLSGSIDPSGSRSIFGTLGKLMDYYRMPPQRGGSQGINATIGRGTGKQNKDFYFIGKTITAEYAKIIDDYFTMFGYAINEVAIPNMNARPHYTYVQTQGCIVKGEMPADDCKAIESIFNKGVRFWKNINEIGNYTTINNSPT